MESRFPKGVLLFSITLAVISPTSGKAITCIGGDYTAGDSGSIMCFFPDDIDAHENVYIQRNPFSAPAKESGTEVFICNVEDLKASKCKEEDGYVLKKYTRNTIWVDILNMTERVAGRYTCQFVPPDDSPTEMCNITVRGAVTPASAGDRQSTTVVEKRESSTDANAGETGTNSVGIIVGVVVAFLVLAAVIIVLFIMRRRRNRRMKTRRRDSVDGSAPAKTLEQATKKSVNPSAAGPNDPLLPTHATRVTSPAARAVPKPAFETQPSVESYMKPLAEVDVGTSSVTQSSQIIRTAAPPLVQDDCEGIGGAYYTEQKSPDTPKCTYPSGCIEIDNNSSYNFEKSEIPSSPTTDREDIDAAVLLTHLYKVLQIVKTKAEALEEGKRSRASYAGTSNDSQTSKEILRTLLRKLRESGARLQRQAESREEPVDVEPVISCVEQILDHVERGVDEQTHEAICKIPAAAEFEEVSCNIS